MSIDQLLSQWPEEQARYRAFKARQQRKAQGPLTNVSEEPLGLPEPVLHNVVGKATDEEGDTLPLPIWNFAPPSPAVATQPAESAEEPLGTQPVVG